MRRTNFGGEESEEKSSHVIIKIHGKRGGRKEERTNEKIKRRQIYFKNACNHGGRRHQAGD